MFVCLHALCNYPTRFGDITLRLLRNTEIKGISSKFAHRSLLISREAKETKTQGNDKVRNGIEEGVATMKKFKLTKEIRT